MKNRIFYLLVLIPFILYSCNYSEKESTTAKNALPPLETGQNIAMKTKGVLGKNLLQAINTLGTENALSFCSTRAIALTDSMAVELNAKIKRVSDKSRNPQNEANEAELDYIKVSKESIAKGEGAKPQIVSIGDKQLGYYPIMTNQMCLQCHGQEKTEILPNTLSQIKTLYPDDKAIGYKVNELRGIWVVEMNNY